VGIGELGIDVKTVWAALQLLEQEGMLIGQGAGRARRIVAAKVGSAGHALRVAILAGERSDLRLGYMVELQHQLTTAGYDAFHPPSTLEELRMNVRRVARLVEKTEADAWIVMAASREVLEWFAGREIPTFAIFGRRRGVPVAGVGPDKPPAYVTLTNRLHQLGHCRMVMLVRSMRRLPEPGASEAAFLDTLRGQGIATGSYHLPDWEDSKEGFHACLISLFQHTPPTALIIDEGRLLVAALQFCADRRIVSRRMDR
jgi:DNA-binding LacI/PurR family transcriptional regulator